MVAYTILSLLYHITPCDILTLSNPTLTLSYDLTLTLSHPIAPSFFLFSPLPSYQPGGRRVRGDRAPVCPGPCPVHHTRSTRYFARLFFPHTPISTTCTPAYTSSHAPTYIYEPTLLFIISRLPYTPSRNPLIPHLILAHQTRPPSHTHFRPSYICS